MDRVVGSERGAIIVLWVGRSAARPWEELAGEYAGRLARLIAFRQVRVRPAGGRGGDPARALAREGAALRSHLADGDCVVALDERGSDVSTEALAGLVEEQRRLGRRLVFLLGSDLGLEAALKRDATARISLSRLTLPHALARLVLLEQLYRACDLLAGGSYHRSTLAGSRV